MRRWAFGSVLTFAMALVASDARAHPIGFAVLSIDETAPAEHSVVLRVSGSETDPGNLAVTWPSGCVEEHVHTSTIDEVRERRSTIRCEGSLLGQPLTVEGPRRGIELLVEAQLSGHDVHIASQALPATVVLGDEASGSLFVSHLLLGIEHFALGIDHVLFVIGAFFLARRLGVRSLVMVISAFTLGHALTLALATLDVLVLAPRPVEACIALSLVHVARELRLDHDTITRTRPALVAGLFGLVHGAGFARALGDAGLRGGDLAMGLVSFNLGLEIAQLALVLICFALFRSDRVAGRALPVASMMIGGAGAFFFLDRVVSMLAGRVT